MSILENIRPLRTPDLSGFIPVTIDDHIVGWTRRDFAGLLADTDTTWDIRNERLALNPALDGFDARTIAIDKTFMKLSANGDLPPMPDYQQYGGIDWFGLGTDFDKNIFAAVKRFYSAYLGSKNQTVIINGYHNNQYWVATRGQMVHEEPGMLDIVTAGAVDYRHSIAAVLAEEAATEAGLDAPEMARVKPVGALSLQYLNPDGFLRDEIFHIFDLDTGGDIIPQSRLPLEVEGFQLMPFDDLIPMLEDGRKFKSQINLVVTDFLVRHGYPLAEFAALQQFLYEERKLEDFVR